MVTSPIRTVPGTDMHLCLPCTSTERRNVFASDPVAHVEECHPAAANAVRNQFAPRHHKIRRSPQ